MSISDIHVAPDGWQWHSDASGNYTGIVNTTSRNLRVEGVPRRSMVIVTDDVVRIAAFPSPGDFEDFARALVRREMDRRVTAG